MREVKISIQQKKKKYATYEELTLDSPSLD